MKALGIGIAGFMVGGFTGLFRKEKGGRVATFTHFTHDVHLCPGDTLKITTSYHSENRFALKVYHVEKDCCVLGVSKQGRPVIQDTRYRGGHRLSTLKELAPDGYEVQPRPTPREYSLSRNGMC